VSDSEQTGRLSPELRERGARVRLVLLDVDGVLTDGCIHVTSDGGDGRCFHSRDGLGIRLGQQAGLTFGIISGRSSEVVSRRAAELDITEVHQGIGDKVGCLDAVLEQLGVAADAVCFVGDDLVDVPVMRRVGLAAAPSDAAYEAREVADYVAASAGGRGAVREVVELLLRASGKWSGVTQRFLE
jgi:3-deoxy-D-manno-octulosonate 8-phosphate phosphatase (KDO 8-P phosphatase)